MAERLLKLPAEYDLLTDTEIRSILASAVRAKTSRDSDIHIAFSSGSMSKNLVVARDRDATRLVGGRPLPSF